MGAPIVIADEFTAAGFRLAGARTVVPAPGAVAGAFAAARGECELLLVSAHLARELAPAQLADALLAARPLLLLIGDAFGGHEPPDLAGEVGRTLGVAT